MNHVRTTLDQISGFIFAPHDEARRAADFGKRRHKVFAVDFDARAANLAEIQEDWDEPVKEAWRRTHAHVKEGLAWEFGAQDSERKFRDFIALGPKPMSLLAHHNELFEQARNAFVGGAYYPALTSVCALGERILNHMIVDLRESFRDTPAYKSVHRKASFSDWGKAVDVLLSWNVLLPEVVEAFRLLEPLRHRSLHFTDEARDWRADALASVGHMTTIVGRQFGGFGDQPWFILGTRGHCFIKREYEDAPFVRHYFLPRCPLVGVRFGMAFGETGGWTHIDLADYGDGTLSDQEFCDAYNDRDPAKVLALSNGDLALLAKQAGSRSLAAVCVFEHA